jgi:hypothetical protein
MVQKSNRLSVYFMLLAWVVITAHQVIPHDHHSGNEAFGNDQKCPLSGESSSHHKGLPLHCHAFNDLSSEKIAKLVHANYLQHDLFSGNSFSCTPEPGYITVSYLASGSRLPQFYHLNFFSLRSPPFLS